MSFSSCSLCEGFSESSCIIHRLCLPSKLARLQRLTHACKYSERNICHCYTSMGRPTDSGDFNINARGIYNFHLPADHCPRPASLCSGLHRSKSLEHIVVAVVGRRCPCLSQRWSWAAFLVRTAAILACSFMLPLR